MCMAVSISLSGLSPALSQTIGLQKKYRKNLQNDPTEMRFVELFLNVSGPTLTSYVGITERLSLVLNTIHNTVSLLFHASQFRFC